MAVFLGRKHSRHMRGIGRKWLFVCLCLSATTTGCPKKTHFENAIGTTVHWLNHNELAPLVSGSLFFGRLFLRLSRIKPSKVMVMVKFSPTALNFGYDFVLIVYFLGHPVCIRIMNFCNSLTILAGCNFEVFLHQGNLH